MSSKEDFEIKYPHLVEEFGFLHPIVRMYEIDLSFANKQLEPETAGCGQPEPSIDVDLAASIHQYNVPQSYMGSQKGHDLQSYVRMCLLEWAWSDDQVDAIFKKYNHLQAKYHCRECDKPIDVNRHYHRSQLCTSCEEKSS